MIRASVLACLATLLFCGAATAQRNLYGTLSCAGTSAPDAARKTVPKQVPDPPGKAAPKQATDPPAKADSKPGVIQLTCSWPEPLVLADIASRDAQASFNSKVTGSKSQDTADFQIRMNNDDQITLHFAGTSVLNNDGSARSRQGAWTITKGTGTFNGITGEGDYDGIPRAAGGMDYDLQGSYELPSDVEKPPALLPTPQQEMAPPQQQTPSQNKSKDVG